MELLHSLGDFLQMLGFFGGIGLVVLASNKAKLDKMKVERQLWQKNSAPDADLAAEMRALKEQMAQMHSTSHQFDLSFDEALNRLESRVSRIETKSAASTATPEGGTTVLRNGQK